MEEQVFSSNIIARASLLSAISTTETVPSEEGVAPTYRPAHELRFNVHEYLKGSGPAQVMVTVFGRHTYLTEAEAERAANYYLSSRNAAWDDSEGVIFLDVAGSISGTYEEAATLDGGAGASGASGSAASESLSFTQSNYLSRAEWDYTIDTLSRAWLPASNQGGASGQSSTSSPMFITDGSESPPPLISLADLRSEIEKMDALMKAGEGIEGYDGCVSLRIRRERSRRAQPWVPIEFDREAPSGSSEGTEIFRESIAGHYPYWGEPKYSNFWLSGAQSSLFRSVAADDDSSPGNGYDQTLNTSRPLPSGSYVVRYNWQHYRHFPCNFMPDDAYIEFTVTAAAPAGTLHEAFFDSEDIGLSSVGAGSGRATLKPADFSAEGGATTTIQRIAWDSNRAWVELSSSASLSGHHLDFIELDGSVGLRLDFDDAISTTTDSGSHILRWGVCDKPWSDGDKLMLRMSQSPTDLSGTTNDSSCDGKDIETTTPSVTDMICSNGVVVPNPTDNPQLVRDCETILRALDTLELPDDIPLKWIETKPLADWIGVVVSGSPARITELGIRAKGLEGSVPPELSRLDALRVLGLSWNRLRGEIPSELGRLSELEKLYLHTNKLSGEIPSELGDLDNLNLLRLSGNEFSGCVPASLSEIEDNDIPKLELDYCE